MWDDVIIGSGSRGCTATKCFNIPGDHGISENRVSFWISNCIADTSMTIFKNTHEGNQLGQLIEEKAPLGVILKWCDTTILKNIDPQILSQRIKLSIDRAFSEGKREKACEILSVLGIR